MNKNGPIIIIEDDADDRLLLEMVFRELNYANPIAYFQDGEEALEYLKDESIFPFLILSDINLPKLDGFELRKMVHTNDQLSSKCIPYLFFSTSVDPQAVYNAYTMSVQGFFIKPSSYVQLRNTIKKIIAYWQECYSPGTFT